MKTARHCSALFFVCAACLMGMTTNMTTAETTDTVPYQDSKLPVAQRIEDLLGRMTLEEKIAHGGHPVLRWMMDNIFVRTDPAGNIKPDKEKSTERIDGAVATIMALDRAIRCGGNIGCNVYDERGILIL